MPRVIHYALNVKCAILSLVIKYFPVRDRHKYIAVFCGIAKCRFGIMTGIIV